MERVFRIFCPLKQTNGTRAGYGYRVELDERLRPAEQEEGTSPLSSLARRVRMGALAVTMVALLLGTFWGDDDHFPFGPFRMYSVANKTDGVIRVPALEATTESGLNIDVAFSDIGLRRAELEGQIDRFIADESLMRHLITAYDRFANADHEIVEFRVVEQANYLRDGSVYKTEEQVVATWSRS